MGGAMWTNSAPLSLNNATLTGNTAPVGNGGAIRIETGTTTLSNTIVASNTGGECSTSTGAFASAGYNIASDASCGLTGAGDRQGVDPKLASLADNGGPTRTHALKKGSPAIGGGSPTIARAAGGPSCEPTDQRGLPRKDCDVGAYELVLCARVPVNRIGTGGKDVLRGTGKADGMLGLGGKDRLIGKGGKDGLCGGPGKDKLNGGPGKDKLNGGPGKDVCNGGPGTDRARKCETTRNIP
jgi:hypothetical protein